MTEVSLSLTLQQSLHLISCRQVRTLIKEKHQHLNKDGRHCPLPKLPVSSKIKFSFCHIEAECILRVFCSVIIACSGEKMLLAQGRPLFMF